LCRVGGPAFNAYAKYKVGAPLFAFLAKGGYDAACGAVLDLVENLMLQTASYPPLQETQGRATRPSSRKPVNPTSKESHPLKSSFALSGEAQRLTLIPCLGVPSAINTPGSV